MSVLQCGLCPALSEEVIEKLREIGIRTVTDLITKDLEDVAQQSKVSFKDLLSIVNILLAQYSSFPVDGESLYDSVLKSTSILPSGNTGFDRILDGGLYTGEVTEIAGEIASGKTQICLSITTTVAHQARQNVLFIDTCGGFSAERLEEMLYSRYGMKDSSHVLARVRYVTAHDVYSLLSELQKIKINITQQADSFYSNMKLIIIDNVASVVYPILGGNQLDGHGLIVQLSQLLKLLAVDFALSILVVNNVVNSDGERKASLGKVWSHVPHNRILLSRTGEQNRCMTLVKSSRSTTHLPAVCYLPDR